MPPSSSAQSLCTVVLEALLLAHNAAAFLAPTPHILPSARTAGVASRALHLGARRPLSLPESHSQRKAFVRGVGGVGFVRASAWGGDLHREAAACAAVVQKSSELCLKLASEMKTAGESLGKEMSKDDVQSGISIIKEGDSTPVTAADFAIQGLVSRWLQEEFPDDRFMGEEDASALRDDPALCKMAVDLANRHSPHKLSEEEFLAAVDRGLEPDRGQGERVWILDPIDGTKGFMTGKNYIVGLALCAGGTPLVAAMGNPRLHPSPCVMVAVKGYGLKYWPAEGAGPVPFSLPPAEEAKRAWRAEEAKADHDSPPWVASFPPWLVSRPMSTGSPIPFGPAHPPSEVCCGAMIKYWCVAQGTTAGFIQFETPLKAWDHACGVLCVIESGGVCTDANGDAIVFDDREFGPAKGIICAAEGTSEATRRALVSSVAES